MAESLQIELDGMGDPIGPAQLGPELELAAGIGRCHQPRTACPHLIGLTPSELGRSLRSQQAVDPGGSAADPIRIDLDRRVSGGGEDGPGRGHDPLGMSEMARILNCNIAPGPIESR